MRRILSILLTLVLGLGTGVAAVPVGTLSSVLASGLSGKIDQSNLPACCRRNGVHHCSMHSQLNASEVNSSDTETTVSAIDCCPCWPRTLASTAAQNAAVVHTAADALNRSSKPLLLPSQDDTAAGRDQRSQPKRGPPSLQA